MDTLKVDDNPVDKPQQQRSWVETQLVPRIEAAGCLQGTVTAPYVSDDWRPFVEFSLTVEMVGEDLVIKGENRIKGVFMGAKDDTESFEVTISPSGYVSYGLSNTGERNMFDERIYAVLFAANEVR